MRKNNLTGVLAVAVVSALGGALGTGEARAQGEERVLVARSRESAPLAPDAAAVDARGKVWSLRSLRGRPVILTLFATWCPACRSEMDELDALQRKFGPRGLVILAVSSEDGAVLAEFARSTGHVVPLLRGSEETMNLFGVRSIPTTFFIGRDNRILARTVGASPGYTRLLASLTQSELAAAAPVAAAPKVRRGAKTSGQASKKGRAAKAARPAVKTKDDGVVLLSNSGRRVLR